MLMLVVVVVTAVTLAEPVHKKHRLSLPKHYHHGKRSAKPNPSGGYGMSGASASVSGGLKFSGKSRKASGSATVSGGLDFGKGGSGRYGKRK